MVYRNDDDDELDFEGHTIHETERAWLFKLDNGDQVWLPKSRCVWESDINRMMVPRWLAREKNMI